jgi:Ion transport protein
MLLAMDKFPSDPLLMSSVDQVNLVLSFIFIIEMVIKLLGYGLKGYFMDSFNIFDCVIVISTIVDICISFISGGDIGGSALTALRAFRLLRVFKLAKTWKKLHYLLTTIGRTLKDVATFSVLLALFMFTYTLMGLELFGYKARFDSSGNVDLENGSSPVYNFDTFINAFTTVFIILTNDSWQGMYYNHHRIGSNISATIFFISLVLIGQKILLNVFLAILLENFDQSSIKEKIQD